MTVEFALEWVRGCAVSTVFEKIDTHFVPPTSVQQNKTNRKFNNLSSKYDRGFYFLGIHIEQNYLKTLRNTEG